MNNNLVKKVIHWSLFIVTILYALTGLGITQYRIVEPLTFGLLSKFLSFQIHDNLLVPFFILLSLHILLKILQPENKRPRD